MESYKWMQSRRTALTEDFQLSFIANNMLDAHRSSTLLHPGLLDLLLCKCRVYGATHSQMIHKQYSLSMGPGGYSLNGVTLRYVIVVGGLTMMVPKHQFISIGYSSGS